MWIHGLWLLGMILMIVSFRVKGCFGQVLFALGALLGGFSLLVIFQVVKL